VETALLLNKLDECPEVESWPLDWSTATGETGKRAMLCVHDARLGLSIEDNGERMYSVTYFRRVVVGRKQCQLGLF
jgi:hypothetical protein